LPPVCRCVSLSGNSGDTTLNCPSRSEMAFSKLSSPPFQQRQLWDTGDKCGVPITDMRRSPALMTRQPRELRHPGIAAACGWSPEPAQARKHWSARRQRESVVDSLGEGLRMSRARKEKGIHYSISRVQSEFSQTVLASGTFKSRYSCAGPLVSHTNRYSAWLRNVAALRKTP
jgi:hypothetical protein